MASQSTNSFLVSLLPVLTFFAGLFADWIKQSVTRGFEEKKHLSRVIPDLLDLRFTILTLRELRTLPKQMIAKFPSEIRDRIPADLFAAIDLEKLLPVDEKLPERYRRAVDEIAAYRPVLAFRLRGKERYLDLRNLVAQHFGQPPGSKSLANEIVEQLDREVLPAIEEAATEIAKSHSLRMRFSVSRAMRKRNSDSEEVLAKVIAMLSEPLAQIVKISDLEVMGTSETAQKSPSKLTPSAPPAAAENG